MTNTKFSLLALSALYMNAAAEGGDLGGGPGADGRHPALHLLPVLRRLAP